MSETRLIDCAWTKPPAAAIKAAGYVGVLGYISHDRTGKDLSAAQAAAYRKAGLRVGFVFESTGARAKAGKAAGVADRKFAEAEAKRRGYPAGCVIFYAVDFAATAKQIRPYFEGIASVVGAHGWGPYGSDAVVDAVAPLQPDASWQCEAWSGTRVSPHASLYQRIGHTAAPIRGVKSSAYDENAVLKPVRLWGAVAPAPPVKPVKPTPAPVPQPAFPSKGITVSNYKKAIIAVIGAVGTWALAALPDGTVTPAEWTGLGTALLTALGVYSATNKAKRSK